MKPMTLVLLACCLPLMSAACSVKQNPARTEISYPGGKTVYHCPPGQRKKGRC